MVQGRAVGTWRHLSGRNTAVPGVEGGTLPGHLSDKWNVITPLGSGPRLRSDKPTVRTEIPSGRGAAQEANVGS